MVIGAVQVAFHVLRLTLPVTAIPFSLWKALQMAWLAKSYEPLTAMCHPRRAIRRCQISTACPVLPSLSTRLKGGGAGAPPQKSSAVFETSMSRWA